jgi:hypothetical protein
MLRFLFALMLCAGAGLAHPAGAVTFGDTVTCAATLNYYCTLTSATIGAGTEFRIDYVGSSSGRFLVDFSDGQLKLTTLASFAASGSGPVRVLTFGDLTHPITGITSFAVTPPPGKNTNITQSSFSVANGAITLAMNGVTASSGVTITIGLASAPPTAPAPEPAAWAMMVCGFGMGGGMMRLRRRARGPI